MKVKIALLVAVITISLLTVPVEAASEIGIVVGQSRVLPVYGLQRVAVADPAIADVVVVSDEEVVINGKAAGTTTLHIWEKAGRNEYKVTVYQDNAGVEARIRELLGPSSLQIRVVYDSVIIDGQAPEAERERARKIAAVFGEVVDVSSALPLEEKEEKTVRTPPEEPRQKRLQALKDLINTPEIELKLVEGTLFLEGQVADRHAVERAVKYAEVLFSRVVNLIQVEEEPVDIAKLVSRQIGSDSVKVSVHNDRLFLEGFVPSQLARRRAEEIAASYADKVVSLLTVKEVTDEDFQPVVPTLDGTLEAILPAKDPGESEVPVRSGLKLKKEATVSKQQPGVPPLSRQIAAAIGDSRIAVRVIKDTVILEGTVGEQFTADRAEGIASAFGLEVLNLIRVMPGQVRGAEASSPGLKGSDAARQSQRNPGGQPLESPVEDEQQTVQNKREELPEAADLAGVISRAINRPHISVYRLGEVIFVEGEVLDEWERSRAEKIAQALAPGAVCLLRVVAPPQTEEPVPPSDRPAVIEYSPLSSEKLAFSPHGPGAEEETEVKAETEDPEDEKKDALVAEIRQLIDDPQISVFFVGDRLVLEGEVKDEQEAERARQLANALYPEPVDLIRIVPPAGTSLAERVQRAIGVQTVSVRQAGAKLVLTGTVRDQNQLQKVLDIAGAFETPVLNHLELETPLQVVIEVRALEILGTEVSQLGFTWGENDRGAFSANEWIFSQLDLDGPVERISLLATRLRMLAENGDARLLATPSLITMNGKEAEFLAGGEVPVVVVGQNGQEVEWKTYGVRLAITPRVQVNGDITLEIAPEVSTLDWSNGIRVEGLLMPAMKTRRAKSTLRVPDGATIMLAGLLQNEESRQVEKVPVLGDLPILGRLFRSERFQNQQTELVFLVTPRVVYGTDNIPGSLGPQEGEQRE